MVISHVQKLHSAKLPSHNATIDYVDEVQKPMPLEDLILHLISARV